MSKSGRLRTNFSNRKLPVLILFFLVPKKYKMLKKLLSNPKQLFLIDGIGAVLTVSALTCSALFFSPYFGLSSSLLFLLATIALPFMIYSLFCHFLIKENHRKLLLPIIIANIFYCLLTLSLMFLHRADLTVFGFTYFFLEIVIIITLVGFEIRAFKN